MSYSSSYIYLVIAKISQKLDMKLVENEEEKRKRGKEKERKKIEILSLDS